MDTSHNPEFTTIEMYQAYTDYKGMMELIENMYESLALKICGSTTVKYQGEQINLKAPWEKLTMIEAVKKYAGVDYNEWNTDEDARKCAELNGLEVEEGKKQLKVTF